MNIGVDLHGVIDDLPEVFKFLCGSIIKNDGRVHIITGGSLVKSLNELDNFGFVNGVHYNHLFSVLEYHKIRGTEVTGFNIKYGNPEFPDEEWDRTKGDYCRRNNIDIHFDDSLVYNDHFSTPFARLFTHNK